MIITSELLPDLWRQVTQERASSAEKSLVVLHSIAEVDSACATRLLMRFLDQNNWRPSYYPVGDFRDLREVMRDILQGSEEDRTVVMINCGATVYVKHIMEEAGINAVNVRFIIIDSHRPVDTRYNNETDNDYLLLLDGDDPCPPDSVPPFSPLDDITEPDYQQILDAAEGSDDEGGGESDAEEDGGGGGGGGRAKRQKSHAEASPSGGKAAVARQQLKELEERKALLDEYYGYGSSYGKPAALCTLALIEQRSAGLSMADLWPAISGLTDQLVNQRTSSHHYRGWYAGLKDKLESIGARDLTYVDEDGSRRVLPASSLTVYPAPDFRLMLHRHWNLYEAFQYSSYVAPRMQTWREGGLSRMQLLFVNMGLSLEQARISFATMNEANRNLAAKLPLACRNTALSPVDLQFESFEMRFGYSWALSAADCVHALTGLLVRHTKIGGSGPGGGGGGGNGSGNGGGGGGGGEEMGPAEVRDAQAAAARDDFWSALEALDVARPRSMKLLKEGIDEAKALQRAVIRDGGLMITRRQLEANPAHHMQELNLQAIRPSNSDRFRHPLALLRLATFVRDAADVARTARKSKWPMAVVGPDDGSGFCCVVGIRHKQLPRQPQYNVFGTTFQQVLQEEADTLRWDQERDGFDAAVVFVHKDSVPTFMTELKIRLGQQAADGAAAAAAAAADEGTQEQDGRPTASWPLQEWLEDNRSPAGLPGSTIDVGAEVLAYGVQACHNGRNLEDTFSVHLACASLGVLGGAAGAQADEASAVVRAAGGGGGDGDEDTLSFFGVYDGHGGGEVAEFCRDNLAAHFLTALLEAPAAPGGDALCCGLGGARSPASGTHSRGSSGSAFGPCPALDSEDGGSDASDSSSCVLVCAHHAGHHPHSGGCGAPAHPTHPALPPLYPAAARGAAPAATPAATPRCGGGGGGGGGGGSCPASPGAGGSPRAAERRGGAVGRALRQAFMRTDRDLSGTEVGELVGSTGLAAVVGRREVTLAHCGDSRAVLCRKGAAIALTADHKPDRRDEAARVRASGGRVVFKAGSHRVMGLLAMSRALGDHFLRPYVIADPEITSFRRSPDDELLVLATDGLWDVFAAQEAVDLALRSSTRARARGASRAAACRVAAGVLARAAVTRGSRDNITVVVVDLKHADPGPPSLAAVLAAQFSEEAALGPQRAAERRASGGGGGGGRGGEGGGGGGGAGGGIGWLSGLLGLPRYGGLFGGGGGGGGGSGSGGAGASSGGGGFAAAAAPAGVFRASSFAAARGGGGGAGSGGSGTGGGAAAAPRARRFSAVTPVGVDLRPHPAAAAPWGGPDAAPGAPGASVSGPVGGGPALGRPPVRSFSFSSYELGLVLRRERIECDAPAPPRSPRAAAAAAP
ncbi:MAG: CDC45-like protein-domain-containing protein [Monoraphidium minutum]|nr:MAG: CDC45-like protein-domain-containing protein [Monoraphidium minutum]